MLKAFALLLVCQLLGESFSRGTGFPVPGPVVGLMLLLVALMLAQRIGAVDLSQIDETPLGKLSASLLALLGLLFVPAGVGVVQKLNVLGSHAVAIITALVVSTIITMLVSVGVFRVLSRWQESRQEQESKQEQESRQESRRSGAGDGA
jgi:holin-like protein